MLIILSVQFGGIKYICILCSHHYHPSPDLFSSCKTEKSIPIKQLLPISLLPPGPDNHHSAFCLYESDLSKYTI